MMTAIQNAPVNQIVCPLCQHVGRGLIECDICGCETCGDCTERETGHLGDVNVCRGCYDRWWIDQGRPSQAEHAKLMALAKQSRGGSEADHKALMEFSQELEGRRVAAERRMRGERAEKVTIDPSEIPF